MRFQPLLLALAALTMSACSSLLPRQEAATQESWQNFDEAKAAIDTIVPYQTRRAELMQAGIDPYKNPAITILSYSDVVQRFAVGSSIQAEQLERGIRECLTAGKSCTGYSIAVHHSYRNRTGNFWLDSFSIRRDVDITGWSFNALILFVGDTVVYTLYGGQPRVHEHEITRNPLGPFQEWGQSVAPVLVR
jgi:hypothetical protein